MAMKKKVVPRPKSTSGKYKSIYHLMEVLFSKYKNLNAVDAMKFVKKEFPKSSYVKTDHFPWYKTHIFSKQEFRYIKKPKWMTQTISAKII